MLPTLPDGNLFLQHFQPFPGSLWYFKASQPTSFSRAHLSSHPILSAFTEPAATSPSSLPAGGPSWGSLPSIGGASDCGIGRSRWSRPDQSHRFQHLVPTVPDDNVGIPHAAQQAWSNLRHRSGCKGSEGPGNTDTCVPQYSTHYTNTQGMLTAHI